MGRQKSTQKRPQVGPKRGQNYQNIDAGRPQNHENCQKNKFFEGSIFWWFSGQPENRKKGAQPANPMIEN